MNNKLTIDCWEPVQANKAINTQLWPMLKSMLLAQNRMVIELRQVSKTREAEAKYHAMIGEIASQASHLGAKWSADDWKRLLLDAFARETGRTHGKVIPNLDKTGVVEVGIQSRKFSKSDASEFIEWLYAWAANNGVTLSDHIPWAEECA